MLTSVPSHAQPGAAAPHGGAPPLSKQTPVASQARAFENPQWWPPPQSESVVHVRPPPASGEGVTPPSTPPRPTPPPPTPPSSSAKRTLELLPLHAMSTKEATGTRREVHMRGRVAATCAPPWSRRFLGENACANRCQRVTPRPHGHSHKARARCSLRLRWKDEKRGTLRTLTCGRSRTATQAVLRQPKRTLAIIAAVLTHSLLFVPSRAERYSDEVSLRFTRLRHRTGLPHGHLPVTTSFSKPGWHVQRGR
jgi:hypothetical protein